jgi:hypothetical protein
MGASELWIFKGVETWQGGFWVVPGCLERMVIDLFALWTSMV